MARRDMVAESAYTIVISYVAGSAVSYATYDLLMRCHVDQERSESLRYALCAILHAQELWQRRIWLHDPMSDSYLVSEVEEEC